MLESRFKAGLRAIYEIGRFLAESAIKTLADQGSASDDAPTFRIVKALQDASIIDEQIASRFSTVLAETGIAEDEAILEAAKAVADGLLAQDGDAAQLGEAALFEFTKRAHEYGIASDTVNFTVEFLRGLIDGATTSDIVQFAIDKNLLDEAFIAEALVFQLVTLNYESIADDGVATDLLSLYTQKALDDSAYGVDDFTSYRQSYVSERYFATDYVI